MGTTADLGLSVTKMALDPGIASPVPNRTNYKHPREARRGLAKAEPLKKEKPTDARHPSLLAKKD